MFYILFASFILSSCLDEYGLGDTNPPQKMTLELKEINPGSGIVEVKYGAKDAITHKIVFNAPTTPHDGIYLSSANNQTFEEKYFESGNYSVTYYAYGKGGKYDSITKKIMVQVDYVVDKQIVDRLTGGSSKVWKWDRNSAGHLGVGETSQSFPNWYAAQANEKPECLYNDELTFSLTSAGKVQFKNDNKGDTFVHADHQTNPQGSDACFNQSTGSSNVTFAAASSGISTSTKTQMILGDQFMSYYLATNSYEILALTDSELYVRTIETAPDGNKRAWYQRFVSQSSSSCTGGATGNQAGTGSYQLVWADEFDSDGSVCAKNWMNEIGTGTNGWGNNEMQYYTSRPSNISVSNGSLKITAKKEDYLGSSYTSARIKTQNLFEFQYGKVEVRAKLPVGGGTWPAIWMLGSDINTNGWPNSGEVDIMEHVGNNLGKVQSAIHTLAGYGANAPVGYTNVSNVQDWHVYSCEWTATDIKFYVDDMLYFTYNPNQNSTNWPFNKKFFILLNVAMGGNLGGAIDTNFTQSAMEVDYVRVFQK